MNSGTRDIDYFRVIPYLLSPVNHVSYEYGIDKARPTGSKMSADADE